jgi:hypothetical protein
MNLFQPQPALLLVVCIHFALATTAIKDVNLKINVFFFLRVLLCSSNWLKTTILLPKPPSTGGKGELSKYLKQKCNILHNLREKRMF